MKTRLGRLETMLLAYTQMQKKQTVRTGELLRPLRLSSDQEQELFRRLSRGKLIARVRPGLYLVPAQLPLGGSWSPDEILALNTLMEDAGGRYQICGPNAFNRYGFDEQIPTRVYAYNTRISGTRVIGAVTLTCIKVSGSRLGNTERVKVPEGQVTLYSSRVRTLVDAVYDWSRFNTLPRAYDWIRKELVAKRVRASDLVRATIKYGDKGTIRRIGTLLERIGAAPTLLKQLERAAPRSTATILWIPRQPTRGKVNQRWMVVENDIRTQ